MKVRCIKSPFGTSWWVLPLFMVGFGCGVKNAPSEAIFEPDGHITTTFKKDRRASDLMNGVCFVAPPRPITDPKMAAVDSVSANWVCLMPYAYCPNDAASVLWNHQWQWWGEKETGLIATIEMAHRLGKKVLVKPHIWRHQGAFTGDIHFNSDSDWEHWEQDYRAYVIRCAQISDSLNVAAFCFGTELKNPVARRQTFWNGLIDSLRSLYSGKLTYASNWDNYDNIPFWDKLDLIGIDAYFPLSPTQTPETQDLMRQWTPIKSKMAQLSQKAGVPILFTEYGYRSVDHAAHEPYNSSTNPNSNEMAQSNALEALLKSFWGEEWFEGGFLWKWYAEPEHKRSSSTDYSPQNKKAQHVVKAVYSDQL